MCDAQLRSMGVAFLHARLRESAELYGTLLSVIIASAVCYLLPYGMRYAYAGVLQSMSTSRTPPPRPAPAALSFFCVLCFRSSR